MRSNRIGWLLLSPTMIILFLVGLAPFIYILVVGFYDWNPFSEQVGMQFTGADNYRGLVFDDDFLYSVGLSLLFTTIVVVSELIIGFLLAQLLTKDFPGKTLFRVVHTVPLLVAPIAVGAIWRLLTIPGLGPVPYLLDEWFGFDYRIGFYPEQAFITTVLMDIWHWTPFVTLTLLAGLSIVPKEPREAAKVDGANNWQVFRFVTLPFMQPIILSTVFIRVMDALRTVDEVYMLAGSGSGTRYIGIHIFRVVIPKKDWGYGAAMSLLVLYMIIVICWLLFSATQQRRQAQ